MSEKDIKNAPDVLTQEWIDYLVDTYQNNKLWGNVSSHLTTEQRWQVFSAEEARQERESAERYAKMTQPEKDRLERGSAVHYARDHWFVTIFDEYDIVHGKGGWEDRYLPMEVIEVSTPINYALEAIKLRREMAQPDEQFFFFSGRESPFSMYYPAPFEWGGRVFSSAAQFMVYAKAEQFIDRPLMEKVMKRNPDEIRGMNVRREYFSKPVWEMVVGNCLRNCLREKFAQNEALRAMLFETRGRSIALADLKDSKWGIGHAQDEDVAQCRATWRGKNLLGDLLTETRVKLMGHY